MAQCTAHSKQNNRQCGNDAIKGATVCRMHGGAAPQVRASAQERLLSMVDPALGVLARSMRPLKSIPPQVALAAAKDVLDRNGLKAIERVEISGELSVAEILRARRKRREDAEQVIDVTPLSDNPREIESGTEPQE